MFFKHTLNHISIQIKHSIHLFLLVRHNQIASITSKQKETNIVPQKDHTLYKEIKQTKKASKTEERDDQHMYWIIFPQQLSENKQYFIYIYHISQDHRGWSVILPHKMLYFHRKNGIHFVNHKIYLFDFTKLCREQANESKQNTRLNYHKNIWAREWMWKHFSETMSTNCENLDVAITINCAFFPPIKWFCLSNLTPTLLIFNPH